MKHYLIDGLNLIHKSSALKLKLGNGKSLAVASLYELVSQFSANYPSYKITLFIDGTKDFEVLKSPRINIEYSGPNSNADTLIKKNIEKNHNVNELIIVSSDTEVYNFARVYACAAIISEDFLKQLNPCPAMAKSSKSSGKVPKDKPKSASRKNVKEFLKLFEENPL